MTQTITITAPGFGYYEDADGTTIGKYDLPPGEHTVGDEVATVVEMTDRTAWREVSVATPTSTGRNWEAEWRNSSTPAEKIELLGERLFGV